MKVDVKVEMRADMLVAELLVSMPAPGSARHRHPERKTTKRNGAIPPMAGNEWCGPVEMVDGFRFCR